MMQGFGFKEKFNTRLKKYAMPTIQADSMCKITGNLEGSDTDRSAKRAHSSTVVRKQEVLRMTLGDFNLCQKYRLQTIKQFQIVLVGPICPDDGVAYLPGLELC